jgi:CRP-like cAMP-binding protein
MWESALLYKKVSGLTNVSDSNLKKLFSSLTKKQLSKGENVLEQGQTCNDIYFVESGYLRTYVEVDGTEVNTDFIFENNFATNLKSLRLSVPSDTTIQSGEQSVVYAFEKRSFWHFIWSRQR